MDCYCKSCSDELVVRSTRKTSEGEEEDAGRRRDHTILVVLRG